MFSNFELEEELTYSHTIENSQSVFIEWNLNQSYNIKRVGNYRYRPGTTDPVYGIIRDVYEDVDPINPVTQKGYYTGATDSDILVNAGFDDNNTPTTFLAPKEKINLLYSLDDCFKQNRPRSGINKLLYLGVVGTSSSSGQFIDSLTHYSDSTGSFATSNIARRPRYYMASRYDDFKYWTSYRTETVNGQTFEYGISQNIFTGGASPSYFIYDAAPFVVYNEQVPTNKIVVKMQTNVGEENYGPYRIGNVSNVPDPLYGEANQTTPKRWAIQYLDENNKWVQAIAFDEGSTRSDGSPIIGSDGQVEIEYGLVIPELYQDVFTFAGEIYSLSMRPELAPYGYAYLYKESETDKGTLFISDGGTWNPFVPEYKWQVASTDITKTTKVLTKLSNPDFYIENSQKIFREFHFVKGLRVVVDTMNKINCTFDLIELSARLVADISDRVVDFSIRKTLADLGNNSMPTGNLIASTGNIALFDYDLSFSENNAFNNITNTGSIVSQYSNTRMKFLFFDIVKNVNGFDYYIPMKTMFTERVPQVSESAAEISMDLRDTFYLLESKKAPELLLTNVSLSYAITVLLDNIGFSNYVFKRLPEDEELIIPFFFVGPDQNVAEVLEQLAISSQSAMFFDEYNNLVVMSKNYLLPESSEFRTTDLTLYGQEKQIGEKIALPNIINISSQEKKVYNGGEINYTTRYIQKSIGSIAQAPYIDEYKTYVYKPVLLWEVAGQEKTKTVNESSSQASGYSLAAMPLRTTLSANVPSLNEQNEIINNIIDFGESIYWLGNYAGYFYANGEVIRYDAVEYSVAGVGNVWISNNQEYQAYFARLRFNGKMYPTGNVRIYANVKNGAVVEHGRGQFGTDIVSHPAGVAASWTDDLYVRASIQNSREYLFNTNTTLSYPTNTGIDEAGNTKIINKKPYTSQSYAVKSTRNGIIKNFAANINITERDVDYYKTSRSGSIQTSALVFNGPNLPAEIDPVDFVTYAYKNFEKPYKHFGTRMRIIGRIESGTNKSQTPIGAFDIYSTDIISQNTSQQVSITGGSGGIAFGLNKDTNVGYYFEIAALSQSSVSSFKNNSNAISYTILKDPKVTVSNSLMTVYLQNQCQFEVGDKVVISGLVDDNRKTSPTAMNGQFTVKNISANRKSFICELPTVSGNQTIVKAVHDANTITYTVTNDVFKTGHIINVSGLTADYNGNGLVVNSVNTTREEKVITAVSANGTYVTYTTSTNHGFFAGQKVNVTGIEATVDPGENPEAYNAQMATIYDTPTANTFRIANSVDPVQIPVADPNGFATAISYNVIVNKTITATSPAPDGSGTMVQVPLNTTSSNGGTVIQTVDNDTLISDVFFYKVVSGSLTADIIKKKRVGTLVTLTTLRDHTFVEGEQIVVTGVDPLLNGEFQITAVGDRTIQYNTAASGNISEADLAEIGLVTSKNKLAIPEVLWRGYTEILVDDGKFTTQSRLTTSEKTTVYDLSAEYLDVGKTRRFYLYLNNKQIAVVDDTNPLPQYNNVALFVRGTSRIMFENVYALAENFAENTARSLQLPISKIFGDEVITESEAIKKYAISGIVQNTYLSGISSEAPPKYSMYYDEFGTIMREAAYFKIRYDRAYPALYAQLAQTINRVRGYTVSGFLAGSYGAEFLIFNAVDKNLNLDDTSGNYLRILGIAFTQNTTHSLKVDDFFKKNSNFINNTYYDNNQYQEYQQLYSDIENSRNKYGRNDFTIDTQYVQTDAAAESMMDWVIKKVMYPRKTVGITTFGVPHIQLGDIVNIDYVSNDIDIVSPNTTRFVVYNIEHSRSSQSMSTTVYLAEV